MLKSMIFLPVISHVFINLFFVSITISQSPDPCEKVKDGAAAATLLAKDTLYQIGLDKIKSTYNFDLNEHCISFGKDDAGNIIASQVSHGSAISGKVPSIANAFADMHNHTNYMPPDAGDLYGLININKNNPGYKTRFVVIPDGTVYALLVTDAAAALAFTLKNPPQPPAFTGGPPGLPVALVDESREMKYKYNCTDEMVVAFILEKYNSGVSLLKQNSNGVFNKIITIVSNNDGRVVFSAGSCQ